MVLCEFDSNAHILFNNGLPGDMSQDPFHRDANVSPAMPGGASSPPPRKRRLWLWVLLIVFGGGFLSLLICCGAGAYLVQNHGAFIFDPVRKELNQVADVQEQIGEIESLNIDFFGTVEEGKNNPDFVIFNGQSDSGPFQLSAKMATSGELEKVFLVMPDGSREPIDMSERVAPSAADEDPDASDPPADGDSVDEPLVESGAAPPSANTVDQPGDAAAAH